MIGARLPLAFESGLELPETGRLAVFGPRLGDDLSALPKDRTQIIQRFKPDFDAFVAKGYDCVTGTVDTYAAAIVILPRAKAEARATLAGAVAATGGGIVVVDGQKTDGVDSLLKDIRKRASLGQVISKAHGKLFWFEGGDFADWAQDAEDIQLPGGFVTRAGVFSADGADPASQMLAEALPKKLGRRVADLGAGWGFLAAAILSRETVDEVHLIEADAVALDCARRNVTDPRARFHWEDATRFRSAEKFDTVVMNPPFHVGRAGDPGLGRAFIATAAAILKPAGELWLVANRHLPYEKHMAEHFREVREISGDNRFKLLHAARPLARTAR
ncbi:MAG: class I SAM-dependent methyltransferase [Rhodobacteraceae bacterium]|nr:class I SAM-dependent methyltransferase [Paracoccaceae bacterium]